MSVLHLKVGSGYLISVSVVFGTDSVQILEDHDFSRPDYLVPRVARVDEFRPGLVVQRLQCLE